MRKQHPDLKGRVREDMERKKKVAGQRRELCCTQSKGRNVYQARINVDGKRQRGYAAAMHKRIAQVTQHSSPERGRHLHLNSREKSKTSRCPTGTTKRHVATGRPPMIEQMPHHAA